MNFLISQEQAIRSTFAFSRVTHFIAHLFLVVAAAAEVELLDLHRWYP